MFGIGSEEFIIIAIFAFMIFGPERLPHMGKVAAKYFKQFKSVQSEVQRVVKNDIVDPLSKDLPLKDNALEELFTGDILKKQDGIQKSYGVYSPQDEVDVCTEKPSQVPCAHNLQDDCVSSQKNEHIMVDKQKSITPQEGLHAYMPPQDIPSNEERQQRLKLRAQELFEISAQDTLLENANVQSNAEVPVEQSTHDNNVHTAEHLDDKGLV